MSDHQVYEISMTSPPDNVDLVHDLLSQVWDNSPFVPVADRIRFETALIELVSNVVRHADDGTGVSCSLRIDASRGEVEARLSDSGVPGDIELGDATMPGGDAESGRGLALIKSLVDDVDYTRTAGENHWRISRAFES